MRSLEGSINAGGEELRRNCRMSQRPERPEEKESSRSSDGGARLSRILLWRQPRQRLHVAEINHRVGWNGGVSGRDYAVEPVCPDQWPPERARRSAGRDLGIGQAWRDAQPIGREQRGIDEGHNQSRHPVEPAWI